MSVLKAIWAIIVGTFVAAVLGMAYDYFRPEILNPESYKFMYPWFTAVPGFISGMIVAMMLSGGAQPTAKSGEAVKGGKAAAKEAKSNPVAGMPTFDFDKAKADIAKPADVKPEASKPETVPSGSRPGELTAPPKSVEGQKQ